LFRYYSNPEGSFSTADVGNLLDQMDRRLWDWHGGDLVLQTAGASPVGGFLQEGES
jgi:hypothetical protein